MPGIPVPLRVHFIHIKSPHPNAIPLLLVPSFPLTNLSLVPLVAPLTDPSGAGAGAGAEDGGGDIQPFHLVIPSIPGLGFSDAFTFPPSSASSSTPSPSVLESTAYIFNALMLKLSYPQYLCSSTGSSAPAVDYHVPRLLAANHANSCIGIHLIDPPVEEPKLVREPWTWTKFAIARFFHASVFGYVAEDWLALTGSSNRHKQVAKSSASTSRPAHPSAEPDLEAAVESSEPEPQQEETEPSPSIHAARSTSSLGLSAFGILSTPNTLSYALCDSPIGLLSLILAGLKAVSPEHNLSQTEVIDVAQLAWLPGPEGAMRYWSSAAREAEKMSKKNKRSEVAAAVTTFLGDEALMTKYRPPMWATSHHNVVWTRRREGRAGLLVWQKPEVVVEGVRGLASEVVKSHPSLLRRPEEVPTVGIELTGVVVEEAAGGRPVGGEIQMDVESPDTVIMAREL